MKWVVSSLLKILYIVCHTLSENHSADQVHKFDPQAIRVFTFGMMNRPFTVRGGTQQKEHKKTAHMVFNLYTSSALCGGQYWNKTTFGSHITNLEITI